MIFSHVEFVSARNNNDNNNATDDKSNNNNNNNNNESIVTLANNGSAEMSQSVAVALGEQIEFDAPSSSEVVVRLERSSPLSYTFTFDFANKSTVGDFRIDYRIMSGK